MNKKAVLLMAVMAVLVSLAVAIPSFAAEKSLSGKLVNVRFTAAAGYTFTTFVMYHETWESPTVITLRDVGNKTIGVIFNIGRKYKLVYTDIDFKSCVEEQ